MNLTSTDTENIFIEYLPWPDFIRQARARLKMTQKQFAKKLGVSQARVSMIERKMPQTISIHLKIVEALKLDYKLPRFKLSNK